MQFAYFAEFLFEVEDRYFLHPTLWNIPGKKYGDARWMFSNYQLVDLTKEELETLVGEKIENS